MEGRRTRQVALALLLAVGLCAQAPAPAPVPAPLPARDVTRLLDETAALFKSMGLQCAQTALERDRPRIQQGFTPEIYKLVQDTRARAVRHAMGSDNTSVADRVKLMEVVERWDTHLQALLAQREQRLRNPDRDNLARYGESNRTLTAPAAGEQRVVFLGDSITDGWRLQEYFLGKPYVNRGIGGQITGEMLGRMKADVLDLNPSAIVVLAGTNDLARGVAIDTVKNNLTMIGSLAKAAGIRVILASILPVSTQTQVTMRPPDKILQLNQWMQEHAKQEGFLYLDYHSAMKDDQGLLRAELANDGLHPNVAGYKIMAPLVDAAIQQALQVKAQVKKKK